MDHEYPHLSKSLKTHCLELSKTKFRERYQQLMLEGARIIRDASEAAVKFQFCIVEAPLAHRHAELLARLDGEKIPIYALTKKEFEPLSSTANSQGILAVVDQPKMPDIDLSALPDGSIVVALDRINDPGNLGTIIRTCDWFGVSRICISKGSVDVFNAKVVRGSMGSIFRVSIHEFDSFSNLAESARDNEFSIIAADAHAKTSLDSVTRDAKMLIVFGSEAHGVSSEYTRWFDQLFSIPKRGRAESLNVAVACGIALAELTKK